MPSKHAFSDKTVDDVYHVIKDSLAKGTSLEEIRLDLESHHHLSADEISSGLNRLLFAIGIFIKSQRHEKIPFEDTQRRLLEQGYTHEVIQLAYLRVNNTLH